MKNTTQASDEISVEGGTSVETDAPQYIIVDKKVHMSRRGLIQAMAAGSIVVLGQGCETVSSAFTPSASQMAELATGAWADLKKQERVSTERKYTSRMNRVAPRIIRAAGGNPSEWDVQVFASDQLNAFALPGGKIGFYTGILDLMDNDDQIAAVMGHEVAHVYFNHAGQRYGRTAATAAGLQVAQVALGSGQTSQVALQALGLGAQYGVILPFSRQHELEADKYGLRYMKTANYNMSQAVAFWRKMSAKKSGGAPPEILSTHPSDATRIAQLESEIRLLQSGAS